MLMFAWKNEILILRPVFVISYKNSYFGLMSNYNRLFGLHEFAFDAVQLRRSVRCAWRSSPRFIAKENNSYFYFSPLSRLFLCNCLFLYTCFCLTIIFIDFFLLPKQLRQTEWALTEECTSAFNLINPNMCISCKSRKIWITCLVTVFKTKKGKIQ